MPDIYLGPSGAEVLLPKLKWYDRNAPTMTVDKSHQAEMRVMSDGSRRVGFLLQKRSWPLAWDDISEAEYAALSALNDLLDTLRFQNNWESALWFDVWISSFQAMPHVELYGQGAGAVKRYSVQMMVTEV